MPRTKVLIVTDDTPTQAPSGARARAGDLYQGSFQEVWRFYERLGQQWKTRLLVISSRYGLIDAEDVIEPYGPNEEDDAILERGIRALTEELERPWNVLVLLLKAESIKRLLSHHMPASSPGHLIFVGADPLAATVQQFFRIPDKRYNTFKRVGVARIGRRRQEVILCILDALLERSRRSGTPQQEAGSWV